MLEVFTDKNSLCWVDSTRRISCICRRRAKTCLGKMTISPSANCFGQHRTDLTIKTCIKRIGALLRTHGHHAAAQMASVWSFSRAWRCGIFALAPHTDVRMSFSL